MSTSAAIRYFNTKVADEASGTLTPLDTCRPIKDLNAVKYPEGIHGPKHELNANAAPGHYRYDRDFLLQFMGVCKTRPPTLSSLDALGLQQIDPSALTKLRGGARLSRPTAKNFDPPLIPRESMSASVVRASNLGVVDQAQVTLTPFNTCRPIKDLNAVRYPEGIRGPKHELNANAPPGLYRYDRDFLLQFMGVCRAKPPTLPSIVDRFAWTGFRALASLSHLTAGHCDYVLGHVTSRMNRTRFQDVRATWKTVVELILDKALDDASHSEVYAWLCIKITQDVNPDLQGGISSADGKPISGSQLFKEYLLDGCQNRFEHLWFRHKSISTMSEKTPVSEKTKRQRLGLIKLIGELLRKQIMPESIVHEYVNLLLGNTGDAVEEKLESLCALLHIVGGILDNQKGRSKMDTYLMRMEEFRDNEGISHHIRPMLQDIIELCRQRRLAREVDPTKLNPGRARGTFKQQGDTGWATAGRSIGPLARAGDLSQFGDLTKSQTKASGPSSSTPQNARHEQPMTRASTSYSPFTMRDRVADAAPQGERRQRTRSKRHRKSSPQQHEGQGQ